MGKKIPQTELEMELFTENITLKAANRKFKLHLKVLQEVIRQMKPINEITKIKKGNPPT